MAKVYVLGKDCNPPGLAEESNPPPAQIVKKESPGSDGAPADPPKKSKI